MEKPIRKEEDSSVHYLPCQIAYDGPCPVDSYFKVQVGTPGTSNTPEMLASSFRGRKLVGQNIPLPSGTTGLIVHCTNSKTLQVDSHFSNVVVWEHDVRPNPTTFEESLEWIEVARKVDKYLI